MKTREVQCIHYVCEKNCDLGHDGTFYKVCQICRQYKKKPGAAPKRTDTRRSRLDRAIKNQDCY